MTYIQTAHITDDTTTSPSFAHVSQTWLLLAHILWWLILLVILGFLVTTPLRIPISLHAPGIQQIQDYAGIPPAVSVSVFIIGDVFTVISFVGAAVLIYWRKSQDAPALLLSLLLLTYGPGETTFFSSIIYHLTEPFTPSRERLQHLVDGIRAAGELLSLMVFFVFPDGRYVPRWSRWLTAVYLFLIVLWFYVPTTPLNLIHADSFYEHAVLSFLLALSIHSTGLFSLWYRFRTTLDATTRQQTKWVFLGLTIAFLSSALHYLFYVVVRSSHQGLNEYYTIDVFLFRPLTYLGLTAAPICITIAVLKHRLWDLKPLVNRSLVYGALTACVVGIYGVLVMSIGSLFQGRAILPLSLLATGLVAVLVQPLRDYLQHQVNRLLYGMRDDPASVLQQLGTHLETTRSPQAVLQGIVTTLATTLKLPYVAIALLTSTARHQSVQVHAHHRSSPFLDVIATVGDTPDATVAFPITYHGEHLGYLVVAPRDSMEVLDPPDHQALNTLTHQIAAAVHTLRLTLDLAQIRAQLVLTREEERRRIHRDLHDGLGPLLASHTYLLDTMSLVLDHDRTHARALLTTVQNHTHEAIATVRQVVEGLRPPALDDLGLVRALQEYATGHQGPTFTITIDAPDQLPVLSAAVEVAAYRIVQEALTNVIRHAHAQRCVVTLCTNKQVFLVQITDDGQGLPQYYQAGIGLTSMRERAEELGGTLIVAATESGGTTIRAQLPLDCL